MLTFSSRFGFKSWSLMASFASLIKLAISVTEFLTYSARFVSLIDGSFFSAGSDSTSIVSYYSNFTYFWPALSFSISCCPEITLVSGAFLMADGGIWAGFCGDLNDIGTLGFLRVEPAFDYYPIFVYFDSSTFLLSFEIPFVYSSNFWSLWLALRVGTPSGPNSSIFSTWI